MKDLEERVRDALKRGHGPDCEPSDDTTSGRCVCEQAELVREIFAERARRKEAREGR